jgi:hypothetical protein
MRYRMLPHTLPHATSYATAFYLIRHRMLPHTHLMPLSASSRSSLLMQVLSLLASPVQRYKY